MKSMKSNVSISSCDVEREIVRIKESFEFKNRRRLDWLLELLKKFRSQ